MSVQGSGAGLSADCELHFDDLHRQLYATDASIYQITPAGVAFPRSAAEAASAIRAAAEAGWPVIPRGAGTGLVGGALGDGLVVDFARHNRGIRDFCAEDQTVRVGAGVVLDELNAFLQPHGLWFGPDVATSSRATLGGMISNDSSGARVPVYGTTIDHVQRLEIVLADGTVAEVSPELDTLPALRRSADAVVDCYAEAIAGLNPWPSDRRLKRRPGYGFSGYLRHRGDLTRLIGGSEGTLAGIFSATLRLSPLPRQRGLGLVFFASVAEAMQATVELLDLKPAAIEHIDRILFDQTKGQLAFQAARSLLRLDEQPPEAILIVELFDEDVLGRLETLAARRLGLRTMILRGAVEQSLVWGLRKAGLALLTGRPGAAKPVTGIEDAAVLPEQLPEYVAALRRLLDPLDVKASFYGHAASGLLHVRPVLDLHTHGGVATLRHIADEVSALIRQFKGSIAGEHGVGLARTEYLPAHLGPALMEAHVRLKRAFDPRGVMNPGKIVPLEPGAAGPLQPSGVPAIPPLPGRPALRIDTHLRQGAGELLTLPFEGLLGFVDKDHSFVGNLEQCSGVGACLKRTPAMCPTYIATGHEIMSTRGRANTIRAVLQHRVGRGGDPILSEELTAALEPCLACKACKTECPSNVDLALLKAELLHERHRRTGISLRDRVIASADLLGRLGCATAPVANRLIRWRPLRRILHRSLGIVPHRKLPPYAGQRFDRWFMQRAQRGPGDAALSMQRGAAHAPGARRGRVVLWDDTWVRYHEPHVGRAAVSVLEALGYEVVLPAGRACCGRPAFSRGLLRHALRLGRHNVELLQQRYPGLPVVFLEPSCMAMFQDEYRQLMIAGASALQMRCVSFEAFVDQTLDREPQAASWWRERSELPRAGRTTRSPASVPRPVGLKVAIHAHCHARALTHVSVLPRLACRVPGAQAQLLDTGCCGMAGAYGMLQETHELSEAVAGPLLEKIKALEPGTAIIASGTSCRHQIEELAGVRALHMAEWLAMHV